MLSCMEAYSTTKLGEYGRSLYSLVSFSLRIWDKDHYRAMDWPESANSSSACVWYQGRIAMASPGRQSVAQRWPGSVRRRAERFAKSEFTT
jgi:hypothetical protein